jgi:hypothetical protein
MRQVIKLTERDLQRIVKRVINEDMDSSGLKDINLKEKLDQIFFGKDEMNIFSDSDDFGYLSRENRLSKKVSPRQRIERIKQIKKALQDYVDYLEMHIGDETPYLDNPRYQDIWKDVEKF